MSSKAEAVKVVTAFFRKDRIPHPYKLERLIQKLITSRRPEVERSQAECIKRQRRIIEQRDATIEQLVKEPEQ